MCSVLVPVAVELGTKEETGLRAPVEISVDFLDAELVSFPGVYSVIAKGNEKGFAIPNACL